jgi:hypothetical protein
LINTRVPVSTRPTSRIAISAVSPDITAAAASSNVTPAGFAIS